MSGVQDVVRSVNSHYQLEAFKDMSETVNASLKGYLHASLGFIGHLNMLVAEQGRSSPVQSLELDSLVSRQLFGLQAELSKHLQQCFSKFESEIAESVVKLFALDVKSANQYSVSKTFEQTQQVRQRLARRPTKTTYSSLQRFIADVPSRLASN